MSRLAMPAHAGELGVDARLWDVLVETIFPTATDPEVVCLALVYCRARGLDPLRRPVHIVPMWDRAARRMRDTIWPGIGSLLIDAARTGAFAGQDVPAFGPAVERTWEDADGRPVVVRFPEWADQTVYRLVGGARVPFTARVYWLEAYARAPRSDAPNEMWRRRPFGQLGKCALAAALRSAFPEAGDYTAEEMEGQVLTSAPVSLAPTPDQPRRGVSSLAAALRQATPEPVAEPAPEPAPEAAPAQVPEPSPEPAPEPRPKRRTLAVLEPDGSVSSRVTTATAWLAAYLNRREALATADERRQLAARNLEVLRRLTELAAAHGEASAREFANALAQAEDDALLPRVEGEAAEEEALDDAQPQQMRQASEVEV